MSIVWLYKHFHPQGLRCPHCHAGVEHRARVRQQLLDSCVKYQISFKRRGHYDLRAIANEFLLRYSNV
jgi:hypothetical protein